MTEYDGYIGWFEKLGSGDVARVGGKNASLGEMVRSLKDEGVRVPDGFATTAVAYREYVAANGIGAKLRECLGAMKSGAASLHQTGQAIRRLFLDGEFPEGIAEAVRASYSELSRRSAQDEVAVAVRSSATAEDLPEASFAGQQETFLNVRGERALLEACRRCYASLFTDRAISYRETKGFDHLQVALSIGVQRMVRADRAGSGVMFSIDTETGFPGVVVINAAWGLGENVVQGAVNPDKYLVFKQPLGEKRYRPIIEKARGEKESKMVYAEAQVAKLAKEMNAKLILDSSGEALQNAGGGGVYLMKPNLRELSQLVGRDLRSEQDQIAAGRQMLQEGHAEVVVVSLGADGALLITVEETERFAALDVPIRSAVGAGDSMVGAIALALARGATLRNAVRYGMVAGAAALMTEGTELCRREDVDRLYRSMQPDAD